MRCLNLAEALRRQQVECQFVCREHEGNLLDIIGKRGFAFSPLPARAHKTGTQTLDYGTSWLGETKTCDAQHTAATFDGVADWLVVDHYGIDISWEEELEKKALNLLVIDDLANRIHDCDLLVDQNWYGPMTYLRYENHVPETCIKFLVPRYAILDKEYLMLRDTSCVQSDEINNVLVFMGGSDSTNQTAKVLLALSDDRLSHLKVTVVIGKNHPAKDMIRTLATERGRTNLQMDLPNLAGLMAESDLMIGAGGISNWERFCLGLPAIVMSVAENQVAVNKALAESELINYLGPAEHVAVKDIVVSVIESIANPEILSKQKIRMMELVPGNGADVIASHMIEVTNNASSDTH